MKINTISQIDKRERLEVLVIPFWQEKKSKVKGKSAGKVAVAACDIARFQESVAAVLKSGDLTADVGTICTTYGKSPLETRLLLVGLGDAQTVTHEVLRRAYAKVVQTLSMLEVSSCTILLPQSDLFQEEEVVKAIGEGIFLTNYKYLEGKVDTKKEKGNFQLSHLQFIGQESALIKDVLDDVLKIVKGVFLARDLVNGNADYVTPKYLASVTKDLCKRHPRLTCFVHDRKWIEKQGMGLLLAVAQGSRHEPQFIVIRYQGNPSSSDHTVLVGKSVTFDTGGLNLKPTGNIEGQRGDMGGAAAVLGTLSAISDLSLPINVTGVIAACENAVGPHAYKPGDIFKSYHGKTVEVNNTDAEGRLTLADALAYTAKELKPSRIIDLATLTGACLVAFGHEVAALLSNSDLLVEDLMAASHRTFERIWRLPLYEEYREKMRSDIADIKNTAGREGGTIMGGSFLQDFVGDVVWAHLDIAGTAMLPEAKFYRPKYGTGFGVRLLVDFLRHLCQKE